MCNINRNSTEKTEFLDFYSELKTICHSELDSESVNFNKDKATQKKTRKSDFRAFFIDSINLLRNQFFMVFTIEIVRNQT